MFVRRIGFAGRRLPTTYVALVGCGVGIWPLRCFPRPPALLNCALRLAGKYRLRNTTPRPPSPGAGEGEQESTSVRSRGAIRWGNPISRPARQVRIQWCGSEADEPPAAHYGLFPTWAAAFWAYAGGFVAFFGRLGCVLAAKIPRKFRKKRKKKQKIGLRDHGGHCGPPLGHFAVIAQ